MGDQGFKSSKLYFFYFRHWIQHARLRKNKKRKAFSNLSHTSKQFQIIAKKKAGIQPSAGSSFIFYTYLTFYSFFAFFPWKKQRMDRWTGYRDARTDVKMHLIQSSHPSINQSGSERTGEQFLLTLIKQIKAIQPHFLRSWKQIWW